MVGTRGPVPVRDDSKGDLAQQVLELLDAKAPLQSSEDFPSVSQPEIKAALDRLASRSMVQYETRDQEEVVLTGEGEQIVAQGSHEYKVWEAVRRNGGLPVKELVVSALFNFLWKCYD